MVACPPLAIMYNASQERMPMGYLFFILLYLPLLFSSSCQTPAPLIKSPPQGIVQKGSLLRNAPEINSRPYVLLISIDGYRYDYTQTISPPTLSRFIEKGVHAEGLIPIFPSITFPNHYTIVTGLRAEKHGIVSNSFWDPITEKTYHIRDRQQVENGSWYQGEPLWVAATKQNMVSASYFWVGSEANIQDIHPSYWVPYDHQKPNRERVKQVLQWFQMPEEKRPHLVTLYFSDVDGAGHAFGPESKALKESILHIDKELKFLFDGLKKWT